jgi:iron complex outermembrane recepter protein
VDNSFGDERIDGGEIGFKSRLLERTLSFNVASYYYIYKGLQAGSNQPAVDGIPVIKTLNAGEAKIYGVDLDAAYRPPVVAGLTLSTAINWNYARFTDVKDVPCWGG